jgi:flagellar biosynthesis/type III secretory pathway chaperone
MVREIDALCNSMEEQLACYRQLFDLAQKEKQSLLHQDISAIAALLKEKEVILLKIKQLEALRKQCIDALSRAFRLDGKELTLDRLTAVVDKSSAQRLEKLKEALSQLTLNLHKINQDNELLIHRHLGYINDIIKIFVTFGRKRSHYRKSGSLECEHRNLYDHRA